MPNWAGKKAPTTCSTSTGRTACTEQLPALAAEVAARKPALIVAASASATIAAARAVADIPIVQANGSPDPVQAKLAASLARPGGMVTGLTNMTGQVVEKTLELLLAAVPTLRRVGFLFDSSAQLHPTNLDAARRLIARYRVERRFAEAANSREVEAAIERLVKEGAQALVVMPGVWTNSERDRVIKLGLAHRWPLLANIYLHYVFDLWAKRWREHHAHGRDCVCQDPRARVCLRAHRPVPRLTASRTGHIVAVSPNKAFDFPIRLTDS